MSVHYSIIHYDLQENIKAKSHQNVTNQVFVILIHSVLQTVIT